MFQQLRYAIALNLAIFPFAAKSEPPVSILYAGRNSFKAVTVRTTSKEYGFMSSVFEKGL